MYTFCDELFSGSLLQDKYLRRVLDDRCRPCLIAATECSMFVGIPFNTCRRCFREWRSTRNSM
jgi:hypothetical protein